MPVVNGHVVNYTFSNCAAHIINGNVIIVNVTASQLNASGLLCSIMTNFSWFWVAFLITIYIITLLMFSYLRSFRLLTVAHGIVFVLATILIGYGFIGGLIWIGTLGMFIISILLLYGSSRF